jgi:hypothetical protein
MKQAREEKEEITYSARYRRSRFQQLPSEELSGKARERKKKNVLHDGETRKRDTHVDEHLEQQGRLTRGAARVAVEPLPGLGCTESGRKRKEKRSKRRGRTKEFWRKEQVLNE